MNRIQIKEQAKKVILGSGKWYILLAIIIVGIIPSIPTTVLSTLAESHDSIALSIISTIVAIICFIIELLLNVGLCTYMLGMVERNDHDVNLLFKGFHKNWFEILKANLLTALYVILGTICFIIPGILMALRYSQINYYFAENPNATYREAMKASKSMMDGNSGKLFVLNFSFFFWYLLVAITFGIAIIYVGPYVISANTIFYNEIKPKKVADTIEYISPYDDFSSDMKD